MRELLPSATGDITVYLRGGVYRLAQPLTFGPQDGGSGNIRVIYTSFPGEQAVLSGGTPITNWHGPSAAGVYTASVPGLSFRQLYADAYTPRPDRARYPQGGQYFTVTGDTLAAGSCAVSSLTLTAPFPITPADIDALDGSEMVILKTFAQSRLPVSFAAITGDRQITIHPTAASGRAEGCDPDVLTGSDYRFRAYFENKPSFLTGTGQWALDSNASTLYYWPRPADTFAAGSIITPSLSNLLTIAGSASNPVRNLAFDRLEFRDTTWVSASPDDYIGTQAGFRGFALVGAIDIKNASGITITRCKLDNFGATGVVIEPATDHITLTKNDFQNVSGNAITVNTLNVANGTDPAQLANHLIIDDNVFQNIGLDYAGVAVFGGYVPNSSISHNLMRYLSYSGISLGWFGLPQGLPAVNTSIIGNDISYAMQLYHDGGGIYTPGWGDNGLTIQNNYVHDITYVPNAGGFSSTLHAGIYLDGYASYVTVSHNLLRNLTDGIYLQTENGAVDARAKHNTITDLGMVSVRTPIYQVDAVRAEAAKPEVANTIQFDMNDRPDIAASAGISPDTRALWSADLAQAPPVVAPIVSAPVPSCSVSASPITLTVGQNVTLIWTSQNADYVIEPTSVRLPANSVNVYTVTAPGTNVYTFTAYGTGGQATCSASVAAQPAPSS